MHTGHENAVVTRRDLRSFGLVMAGALALFGLWGLWREGQTLSTARIALLAGAGLFLLLALASPELLRHPRCWWLSAAEVIGRIVTAVLLTIFFFAVITPIGLLIHLFGMDSLGLRPRAKGESYWIKTEDDGRGLERYEQSF